MYDRIGGVQYIARGAVVLLQLDDLGSLKCLFKAEDVADIGAAEPVYRLVVVSDSTDIAISARQQLHQPKLRRVCVLILIDHDIPESLLI